MADSAQLLRDSWRQAVAAGESFPLLFYGVLFDMDRDLRQLFSPDMREQRRHLVATLGTVVNASRLDDPALLDRLRQLGREHRRYGATGPAYGLVGEALLLTLSHYVEDWTPEHEKAWREAYGAVAGHMMSADEAMAASPRWVDLEVTEADTSDLDLVNLVVAEPDAWMVGVGPGEDVWARRVDRPAGWVRARLIVQPFPTVRLVAPIVDDDLAAVALSLTPVGGQVALAPVFAQENPTDDD